MKLLWILKRRIKKRGKVHKRINLLRNTVVKNENKRKEKNLKQIEAYRKEILKEIKDLKKLQDLTQKDLEKLEQETIIAYDNIKGIIFYLNQFVIHSFSETS